jgi:DNA repair protein RadA/Sms
VARPESRYVCGTCGVASLRWEGQCRGCGNWNTLVEVPAEQTKRRTRTSAEAPVATAIGRIDRNGGAARSPVGMAELDRVLGGGLVVGSVLVLGGEPGIGKSTLVLEVCAAITRHADAGVLYASGEESADQLRLRAERLGLTGGGVGDRIMVLGETSVENIVAAARAAAPRLVVVDSIQTLTTDELAGPAGSVGQVRAAAAQLQAYAKRESVTVIIVGHVTKDGSLAGPKTLEHLVDVVLALEGERFSGLRLLRASKNRFGPTDEVGIFDMQAGGLLEVADPAAAFLDSRSLGAPGVAVAATLEGSRPLLVEVQALVAPQSLGTPRRTVAGLDPNRLGLLIAVLGRRAGMNMASHDVYASLAGGLAVDEPAIDLPLALALASALRNRPLLPATVCAGEIGLTGELRPVSGLERRLREAARLGFRRAIVPSEPAREGPRAALDVGLAVVPVATLREALSAAWPADGQSRGSVDESAVLGSPTR